jgi:hypothetical protein
MGASRWSSSKSYRSVAGSFSEMNMLDCWILHYERKKPCASLVAKAETPFPSSKRKEKQEIK